MTTPVASLDERRQRLADLDALLQRMLSTPLSPAEQGDPPREVPAAARVPIPMPPSPPVLYIRETTSETAIPADQPQVQSWRVEVPAAPRATAAEPALQAWTPPAHLLQTSVPTPVPTPPQVVNSPVATPAFTPVRAEAAPAVMPAAPPVNLAAPAPVPGPEVPVWVWPFVALNWCYDLGTCSLGPLTRWLSAPATKHVMGWVGVMLILLSCGFALSLWLGFDWSSEIIR